MFASQARLINIPQSEHGRLAGMLAAQWGNAEFVLPRLAKDSIVAGVALHDRGYGLLDTFAIGELSEPEWLALTRTGFNMAFADPVADLIVRYHLRRLVRKHHAIAGRALLDEFDATIAQKLGSGKFSAADFERIDQVTDFCDSVSFDFSFEKPVEGERVVLANPGSDAQVALCYKIKGQSIQVAPWPFAVPGFSTFIIGYERAGYPQKLEPLVLPVEISPLPSSDL